MGTFDTSKSLLTAGATAEPRRTVVVPIWWISDDNLVVASVAGEPPVEEPTLQDEPDWEMPRQQERSVSTSMISTISDELNSTPMGGPNRLRRQPSAMDLSTQYSESGQCSRPEFDEAAAINKQTMHTAIATQDNSEKEISGALHHFHLSTDMIQAGLVKISSGPRGVSAQTAATTLESGVHEDINESADDQNVEKVGERTNQNAEDMHSRLVVTSWKTAATKAHGDREANIDIGLEDHELSPQYAEFLKFQFNCSPHELRHHFLTENHNTPHECTAERSKSFMAKLDSDIKARVKVKRQSRGQAVRRVKLASNEALIDQATQPSNLLGSHQHSEPLGPKGPNYRDSMLLRKPVPAHILKQYHETSPTPLFEKLPTVAKLPPGFGASQGNFLLGQAQAVRFSKPGKARLVNVARKKPELTYATSLIPEEAIMFSAGEMAKSARQPNKRTKAMRHREAHSVTTKGATKRAPAMRVHQQSQILHSGPSTEDPRPRPYKRAIDDTFNDQEQAMRSQKLLRWLKTNDLAIDQSPSKAPVQRPDVSLAAPASEQSPKAPITEYACAIETKGSSLLKHKHGYFGLNDKPTQSRIPDDIGSMLTSSHRSQANPDRHSGKSGCPSLISDHGEEPCDSPEAVPDTEDKIWPHHSGTLAAKKEGDILKAANETPSKVNLSRIHINMNKEDSASVDIGGIRVEKNGNSISVAEWFRAPTCDSCSNHDPADVGFHEPQRDDGKPTDTHGRFSLAGQCAILRWLICTSDAGEEFAMPHEFSSVEEDVIPGGLQPRHDDDMRAEMLRMLRWLSDPVDPLPEPSDDISDVLRSIHRPSLS
ncbi:hypothetical protein J7T55_015538 [Diaporthe amygdali]|uniref:uncharacterized protein n=1 Tax=Phomopsis amygdali TaxID=1214568 RepID=UPI0022FED1F9|nr:uncharacterized protein J7T55_015538 [Diaporthe amygdali]KAJ0120803.1 hypothetical protein J7T55_015538 [Diaporthe amygdali]